MLGEINTPKEAFLTTVSDLALVTSPLERSTDSKLYALLPQAFVSDVDLSGSQITIRKQFTVDIALNSNTGLGQLSSALAAGTNETFLPFDEERYVVMRPDGTTVALNDDMFRFSSGNTVLQIVGLGAAVGGAAAAGASDAPPALAAFVWRPSG